MQQGTPQRWIVRTVRHAIDDYAWIGSGLAALLGVIWVLQSQFGISLPSTSNHAVASALGYWPGRLSVLLLVAILVQAAARAGIEEGQDQVALSPAHVSDLHRQAETMSMVLHMPFNYISVNLGTVAARNFGQHFPDVLVPIQAWNDGVQEWQSALAALNARHDREALRPINGMKVQMSGVMLAVATGTYSSPLAVTWGVQTPAGSEIHNLMFIDGKMAQDITVATIPTGADALEFGYLVQRRLLEARDWPESVRVREAVNSLQTLRPILLREFESVQLNHFPDGRCDTCRPLRKPPHKGA